MKRSQSQFTNVLFVLSLVAASFNTLCRRLGVAFPVLCLAAALILGGAASNESRAAVILVPNGDFETLYKPGTTITGVVSAGGWSMGVGLDCPIDSGMYEFSDGNTGVVADIPGWVGYDRQGWWDNGGTYGRVDYYPGDPGPPEVLPDANIPDPLHPDRFGNLQGSVSSQHNHTPGGAMAYIGNGGAWGNGAGALTVSAESLGTVDESLVYTLSMMANGSALPTVFDLLADGVALTPSSSVDPLLSGDWQEFSRTYDATSLSGHAGESLTILFGHGRPATGAQSRYDDISLDAVPEYEVALTWNGGAGTPADGGGTWNTANENWWDTASRTWADSHIAVFGVGNGAAGDVVVEGTVKPTSMMFNAAGSGTYRLTQGTDGVIDLGGNVVNIRTDADAEIQTVIDNGGLNKLGSGTLTLSGANTYTGPTTVNAGTLRVGNSLALQQTTVDMATADAGTLDLNGMNATLGGLQGSRGVTIPTGTTLSVGNNGASTQYEGSIDGSGNLEKIGGGTLTLTASQNYAGNTIITGGTLKLQGGTSVPGENILAPGTVVTMASNTTFELNNVNQRIARLDDTGASGHEVRLGSAELIVGNDEPTTTFSGAISGDGALVKDGTGTLTLTGALSYTGDTIVDGGTLSISSASLSDRAAVIILDTTCKMDLAFLGIDTVSSLWLGGGDMGTGTYGFSTHPDYFTDNTGSLFVLPPHGNYWAPGEAGGQGSATDHLTSTAYKWSTASGSQGQSAQAATSALIFTDEPGTVIVDGTITAIAGLTFEVDGYNLIAGTEPVIDLTGLSVADNTITVATGTTTIGVDLAAEHGMTKAGDGTLELSGSLTNAGAALSADNDAVVVQGAGALNVSGTLSVAPGGVLTVKEGATMTVTGSVSTGPTWCRVGSGGGTETATLILKGSGQFNSGLMVVGEAGTNHGLLVIQDAAQLNAAELRLGYWGGGPKGTIEQNGGTVSLDLAGNLTSRPVLQIGSPAWNTSDGQGEYHLNGGTLITGIIGGGGGPGSSAKFYFNGGTLKANTGDESAAAAGQTYFMQGLTQIVVQEGGAIIDTAGHTITIAQNLEHDADLGEDPDGGLTKLGEGRLNLIIDSNSYTGDTIVKAGTLSIEYLGGGDLADSSTVEILADAFMDLNFTGTDTIDKLVLDGVWETSGTWGSLGSSANHTSDFFTGTGLLYVTTGGAVPGDADGDGDVDAADYIALKSNIGQATGAVLADGDFNGDGAVDWADLQILQEHYGETLPGASGEIPEPATLGLLALGAMAVIRRRRR